MKESAIKFVGGDSLGWIPPLSIVGDTLHKPVDILPHPTKMDPTPTVHPAVARISRVKVEEASASSQLLLTALWTPRLCRDTAATYLDGRVDGKKYCPQETDGQVVHASQFLDEIISRMNTSMQWPGALKWANQAIKKQQTN